MRLCCAPKRPRRPSSKAMTLYSQLPSGDQAPQVPSEGQATQRSTSARFLNAGLALGAGTCFLLLTLLASASTPTPGGAGADEATSLIGLPAASRSPMNA